MFSDSNPNGLRTDVSRRSLVFGESQDDSVESTMKPTAPHKTGRQRGEGSLPVGNSKSKNVTITNHPSPRAHAPNHAAYTPADSAPGSVINTQRALLYCRDPSEYVLRRPQWCQSGLLLRPNPEYYLQMGGDRRDSNPRPSLQPRSELLGRSSFATVRKSA